MTKPEPLGFKKVKFGVFKDISCVYYDNLNSVIIGIIGL